MYYKKYVFVMGTRPEILKLASVIKEAEKQNIDYYIIWTGQHHSYEMSKIFFEDLDLPSPDYNLDVFEISHEEQISLILSRLSRILKSFPQKTLILSLGDTNSALAAGLVPIKQNKDYAHIEAGMRSFDNSMPEEYNRKILDHIATLNFAPTINASVNLSFEGIPFYKIKVSGDTLTDVLLNLLPKIKTTHYANFHNSLLLPENYILVTIHRYDNIIYKEKLKSILIALKKLAESGINIVFPIHPHTKAKIDLFGFNKLLQHRRIKIIKPVGYLTFLSILLHSKVVLTDSGGVQQEAFILGKPCITLRINTEWVETITYGNINRLVGFKSEDIISNTIELYEKKDFNFSPKSVLGIGNAAKCIVNMLKDDELITQIKNYDAKIANFKQYGLPKLELFSGGSFVDMDLVSVANTYGVFTIRLFRNNIILPPLLDLKIKEKDILEAVVQSKGD